MGSGCEAQLGCAGNGNCDYCKQRWEHVGQNFELIKNIYDLVPTNTTSARNVPDHNCHSHLKYRAPPPI